MEPVQGVGSKGMLTVLGGLGGDGPYVEVNADMGLDWTNIHSIAQVSHFHISQHIPHCYK